MRKQRLAVIQAGVTGTKGNPDIPNSTALLSSVSMPVQPKNKRWIPSWHPLHPKNNQ